MKLKCAHHKRRVLIISKTLPVQDSIAFSYKVLHREDGTNCDTSFIRLGDKTFPRSVLGAKVLTGKPFRTDRFGRNTQARRELEELVRKNRKQANKSLSSLTT